MKSERDRPPIRPRASPRLRNHETITHGNEKSGLPDLAENCSVKSHAPDVDAGGNRNNGTNGRRRMMLMPGVVRHVPGDEDRQRGCGHVIAMACGSDLKARAAPDR